MSANIGPDNTHHAKAGSTRAYPRKIEDGIQESLKKDKTRRQKATEQAENIYRKKLQK